MASATTQAVAATRRALDAAPDLDLGVAGELFAVARTLADSPPLSGALADWAASPESRAQVVADVFGTSFAPATVGLVTAAVQERWSSPDDLVDGLEELAVRAASRAEPVADVEGELFQFSRTVATNSDLELALGSRLGKASVKADLVRSLLGSRVSEATTLIAASLVQQPRERRVRQLLLRAERIVADERGKIVARVTAAAPLNLAQSVRLREALSRKYGRDVSINTVLDRSVVGGIRVQIGDDVIDASVSSRLADLRRRLAG